MNRIQLQAMLAMRWHLTRNQWRRGGELNAILMFILLYCGLIFAMLGGGIALLCGMWVMDRVSPMTVLVVWDALTAFFLLFWTIGLVTELQRSEILDLSRLLHLPVSLRGVFLLNYLASHFSISLAVFLPAMLGLAVGLTLGRGAAMLLVIPLMFAFFFMITAWTYCLRGWLASLMINKRRRRAIVMGITMAFLLLSQLPNLVSNVWFSNKHHKTPAAQNIEEMEAWRLRQAEEAARKVAIFEQVHRYVPFLWLPLGAKTLAEGSLWPAMLGFLGMSVIGGWGLARAYRGTIRFYRGGETKKAAPAVAVPRKVDAGKKLLIERALPAIPEEASAMMMASLRSMSRAPEVKMSLATHVIIFGFLGASMFFRHSADFSTSLQSVKLQSWMSGGIVAATFMGLMQLMFNHFGFDRSGFRAFVLLPTPRRYLLLGKNLALLPVALAVFAVYLGVAIFFAKLAASTIMMASFEFITAFSAMSILGNFFAILVPYRIAAGSIKPAKMTIATKFLMIIMSLILFPLAFGLIFLPVGLGRLSEQWNWLPSIAVTLTCSALLALFSAALYWLTLGPLGSLLEQREQKILQAVTQEVE